jgi:prepilin-type processing-associated H-X9-DG protein
MARRRRIRIIRIGIVILPFIVLAYFAVQRFAIEPFDEWKCASNLSALGQTMLLYANDHQSNLPPDLGTLAKEEDIIAEVFICPDSNTKVPANLPFEQLVPWVNANSDYVYLGAGMQWRNDPQIILACEKETNHGGKGMNVLFGDGRVQWMSIESADRLITQQQAQRAVTRQSSTAPAPSMQD